MSIDHFYIFREIFIKNMCFLTFKLVVGVLLNFCALWILILFQINNLCFLHSVQCLLDISFAICFEKPLNLKSLIHLFIVYCFIIFSKKEKNHWLCQCLEAKIFTPFSPIV